MLLTRGCIAEKGGDVTIRNARSAREGRDEDRIAAQMRKRDRAVIGSVSGEVACERLSIGRGRHLEVTNMDGIRGNSGQLAHQLWGQIVIEQ